MTASYGRRTAINWVDSLERVEAWIAPEVERVYAIVDNLQARRATDVLLFSLAHPRWGFVLQPTYGRLPEPDRVVVEDPALAGAERPPLRHLG